MKFSLKNINFLFLTLGLTSYTSPVFAYLDPGTGSILIQGLIGGAAIAMSFLSIYWQKVKAFFVKKEPDSDTEEDIGNNDESS
jgi:hypothetical protein